MQLIRVIIITGKSEIILGIKPDLELRLPTGDAHPLPDVKFLLLYYHWRLNVLLGYPDFIHAAPNVVYQIIFLAVDLDTAAPRLTSWFNNPSIFGAVQSKLKCSYRVF